MLRPGGLLLVTDSAFKWLRSAHDDAVHGARRYTRRELVAHVAGRGLHARARLLRLLPRLPGRGRGTASPVAAPAGGSDVYPLPRPLNTALLGVQAVERALLRVGPLPFGSSVVLVARKAAA